MLLPGDWVEVLPAEAILRTLDDDQSFDGMPFMPEMLPHCGTRHRVRMRAERVCINPPEMPFRQLAGTVVLEGLRCEGEAHGGCELGCMMLWKEAWLRPVGSRADSVGTARSADTATAAASDGSPAVALRSHPDGDPARYFCQATALPLATIPGQPIWRPGQYVRFLRVGTFTIPQLVAMFGRPVIRRIRWKLEALLPRRRNGVGTPEMHLGLRAGDWVEVRTREEIQRTLDAKSRTGGLSFSTDQYRQSGRRMRVLKPVERVIAEDSGRLREVHDTVILEGSICDRYRGCGRGMPTLWREAWLKRAEPPAGTRTEG